MKKHLKITICLNRNKYKCKWPQQREHEQPIHAKNCKILKRGKEHRTFYFSSLLGSIYQINISWDEFGIIKSHYERYYIWSKEQTSTLGDFACRLKREEFNYNQMSLSCLLNIFIYFWYTIEKASLVSYRKSTTKGFRILNLDYIKLIKPEKHQKIGM